MLRKIFKTLYQIYVNVISSCLTSLFILVNKLPRGKFITSRALQKVNSQKTSIRLSDKILTFATPNWLALKRAKEILIDEPETILWIDEFKENSIFWDIGANVGIYSVYAAIFRKSEVVAFEPSFLNLPLLQSNVFLNDLSRHISIFPIGISNSLGMKKMYLTKNNMIPGGAHNSLGQPIDQFGNLLENAFELTVPAQTLDGFLTKYSKKSPQYLKIDVDGLELEVLQGGEKVLSTVKSVLVEILTEDKRESEIHKILIKSGLTRVKNLNSDTRNIIYKRI